MADKDKEPIELPEFDDKKVTEECVKNPSKDSKIIPLSVDDDIAEAYGFHPPSPQKRGRLGRAMFCIVLACVMSFVVGYYYCKEFLMVC